MPMQAHLNRPRVQLRQASRRNGFTLVELAVVLVITAVLVTLAAPAFKRAYQSTVIASAVNAFLSDMRFARSEALRRGGKVILCRSNNPDATNPTCATGNGENGLVSGWIVFHDLNANGNKNVADPVLRVQGPIRNVDAIMMGDPVKWGFDGGGRVGLAGAASITFGSDAYPDDVRRVVCVSVSGRARIAGGGMAECP